MRRLMLIAVLALSGCSVRQYTGVTPGMELGQAHTLCEVKGYRFVDSQPTPDGGTVQTYKYVLIRSDGVPINNYAYIQEKQGRVRSINYNEQF